MSSLTPNNITNTTPKTKRSRTTTKPTKTSAPNPETVVLASIKRSNRVKIFFGVIFSIIFLIIALTYALRTTIDIGCARVANFPRIVTSEDYLSAYVNIDNFVVFGRDFMGVYCPFWEGVIQAPLIR